MKRRSIILAIALVIILLGGILSVAVDNDFGRMHTQRLYLVNDNGYTVTANLFIPNAATAEAPAPAFIVVPGGDCPSDIGSPWATELARRGFVVALVDYSGCGDTEADPSSQYWTNPDGAMELDTVYDFVESLDFVDSDNIGVGGHSMGSLYSYRLSLVRPVSMVVSDVRFNDAPAEYDFNFVQISATHDEGLLARLSTFDEMYTDPFLCGIFGTEQIVPNQLYGSWENRTGRIFIPLNQTHQDDMISGQFLKALTESVSTAMGAPNPLPGDDLVYGWKVVAHILMIIGLVGALFALGGLLVDSRLFESLKLKAPEHSGGLKAGTKGFWIAAVILTLIPVALFFPGTAVGNAMASNALFQLGTTPQRICGMDAVLGLCAACISAGLSLCRGQKAWRYREVLRPCYLGRRGVPLRPYPEIRHPGFGAVPLCLWGAPHDFPPRQHGYPCLDQQPASLQRGAFSDHALVLPGDSALLRAVPALRQCFGLRG